MKKLVIAVVLTLSVCTLPVIRLFADDKPAEKQGEAPKGFVSLFNGKDLDGWKGREGFWRVEDGAITGETKEAFKGPNTFLVWQGGEPANFELRFKYRIFSGNSGVQYRSKVVKEDVWQVGGYQGDFEAGKRYSGILYDESGVAGKRDIMADRGTRVTYSKDGQKKVEPLAMTSEELQQTIRPNDWNEYVIIADGPKLTHKINGHTTIEVIDESDRALKSGVIAIQVHAGPPMKVQVKDIWLKKM